MLAESFVFIYLGLSVFTFPKQSFKLFILVVVAMLACLVARLANIIPNSALVNCFRKTGQKPEPVSGKFQFVMWFSGLRGAVAFVIAVVSWGHQDFPQTRFDPDLWVMIGGVCEGRDCVAVQMRSCSCADALL